MSDSVKTSSTRIIPPYEQGTGLQESIFNHLASQGNAHPLVISGGEAGFMSGTDKAILDNLGAGSGNVISVFSRTGAVVALSGDYTASFITNSPSGTITATDVQAAINELDSDIVALASFYLKLDASNDPITADLEVQGVVSVESIQFDLTVTPPHSEGQLHWDDGDKTLEIDTEIVGTHIQIGQEVVLRATNKTGVLIPNGSVVFVNGAQGQRPTIQLAKADSETTSSSTIGLTTNSIANNGTGYVTTFGLVRGLDTSAFLDGDALWLSAAVGGGITTTRPVAPDHGVMLGVCTYAHLTEGIIMVRVQNGHELHELHDVLIASIADNDFLQWNSAASVWENNPLSAISHTEIFDIGTNTHAQVDTHIVDDTIHDAFPINFWDGSILESIDLTFTEAGGVVSANLEADGGGDLTCRFAGVNYTFDATPTATVALTVGTDTVPVKNYICLTESGGVVSLAANTIGFPATPFCPIGEVVLQSAASFITDGAFSHQNWTDHMFSAGGNGHLSHQNKRLRALGTAYRSGVDPTLTIDTGPTPDDVFFSCTTGEIFQLHTQAFPALDMDVSGDPIYVVNEPASPYNRITNINALTQDSDGVALKRYFTVVIWASASKTGSGNSQLFLNLPSGSYNLSANAIADASRYTSYAIPDIFRGTGFLIAAYTLDNLVNSWVLLQTVDLRGDVPGNIAGGGSSISDHTLLTNIGINTHAQVDSHISDVAIHFQRIQSDAAVTTAIAVDTNVTGAGGLNLDTQLSDYDGLDFVTYVKIYLNGVLLRNGVDVSTTSDVYPGTNPVTGDLKFKKKLVAGTRPDIITMELFTA